MSHTPGPWELGHIGATGSFEIGVGYLRLGILGTDGFVICGRAAIQHKADEMCANALLIAAAPDLLEALKAIVANATIDGTGIHFVCDERSPIGKQVVAAIAKAEGR